MALGNLHWDQEELFGGKNRIQKISWDCPFNKDLNTGSQSERLSLGNKFKHKSNVLKIFFILPSQHSIDTIPINTNRPNCRTILTPSITLWIEIPEDEDDFGDEEGDEEGEGEGEAGDQGGDGSLLTTPHHGKTRRR